MPQIFKFGPYCVFFWSNESVPLEPVHVHVCEGRPNANATKLWITETGKTILCNNNSKIPEKMLHILRRQIEANSAEIRKKWFERFQEIRYCC